MLQHHDFPFARGFDVHLAAGFFLSDSTGRFLRAWFVPGPAGRYTWNDASAALVEWFDGVLPDDDQRRGD